MQTRALLGMRTVTSFRLCSPRAVDNELFGGHRRSVQPVEQTFDGGRGAACQPRGHPGEVGMADAGLFIGFGDPVRGRARRSTSSTSRSRARLQEDGDREPSRLPGAARFRTASSSSAATRRSPALRVSEGAHASHLRAALHVENIGVVAADMGERLQSRWRTTSSRSARSLEAEAAARGDQLRVRSLDKTRR